MSICARARVASHAHSQDAAGQHEQQTQAPSHLVRCWRPHKRSRPQGTLVPTHTFARTHTSLYIGFRRQSGSSW